MSTWTVVTTVRRGEFTVLAVLEGGYQASGMKIISEGIDRPVEIDDTEVSTNLIEAESREQAETYVREKYFPPPTGPIDEVTC